MKFTARGINRPNLMYALICIAGLLDSSCTQRLITRHGSQHYGLRTEQLSLCKINTPDKVTDSSIAEDKMPIAVINTYNAVKKKGSKTVKGGGPTHISTLAPLSMLQRVKPIKPKQAARKKLHNNRPEGKSRFLVALLFMGLLLFTLSGLVLILFSDILVEGAILALAFLVAGFIMFSVAGIIMFIKVLI